MFLLCVIVAGELALQGCGSSDVPRASYAQQLDDKRTISDPATRAQALLDLAEDSSATPTDAEIESTLFYASKACDEISNPRRRCQALIRVAMLRQQRSDRQGTRDAVRAIEQSFAQIDEPYDQVLAAATLAPSLAKSLESKSLAEKFLSVAEEAVEGVDDVEFRIHGHLELVVAYDRLGDMTRRDAQWSRSIAELEQVSDARKHADALIELAIARTRMPNATDLNPNPKTAFENAMKAVAAIEDSTSRAWAGLELIKAMDASGQNALRKAALEMTRGAAEAIPGRSARDTILKQLDSNN